MALPESPAARHEAVAGEFSRLVEQRPRTGTPRRPSTAGPPATSSTTSSAGSAGSSPPVASSCRRAPPSPTTRWPPGATTPTPCRRSSPSGARRSSPTPTSAPAGSHRPSTGSTPPTSSCTPGTWPAPPARSRASTRTSPASCSAGMRPIEAMLRDSGQYGPAVPVADDAPVVERLMGFVGRDPALAARRRRHADEHRGDAQRGLAGRLRRRPARRSRARCSTGTSTVTSPWTRRTWPTRRPVGCGCPGRRTTTSARSGTPSAAW